MVEVETIIAVILVATNVILALAAVAQLRATNRSEARRLQPLVRARQQLPAPYHPPEWGTRFGVHLTNDGVGKAFNVRYGVRVDGVEYPSGPGKGNRHHLDAKENLALVVIDVPVNEPTPEDVRKRAVLYARFEDVIGNVLGDRESHGSAR